MIVHQFAFRSETGRDAHVPRTYACDRFIALLLHSPLPKRLAWRDFLAIKKALTQPA